MKNARGSLSKKLLVGSEFVEKIPSKYTSQEAAGLTLVGLTALELADQVTEKGQRVLVAGGSTSVGLLLIKMLKAKGAFVVATGSGSKLDVIKSRGADDVVDCKSFFSCSYV